MTAASSQPSHAATTKPESSEIEYKYPWIILHNRVYGDKWMLKYPFPIDLDECNRLDICHKLFLTVQDGLDYLKYALPRGRHSKILDLGAGTGIWANDVAVSWKGTEVVAVDFAGLEAEHIPPGVTTVHLDIEKSMWDLPQDFRFVHLRLLYGSIQTELWPAVYKNVYKHLSPEGWIEHSEVNFTPKWEPSGNTPEHSDFGVWCAEFLKGLEKRGRSARVDSARTKRQLAEAGFVNVTETLEKCAVSPWSKEPKANEVGRWASLMLALGFEAMSLRPLYGDVETREPPPESAQSIWKKACREICDLQYHGYLWIHTWRGRKPRGT